MNNNMHYEHILHAVRITTMLNPLNTQSGPAYVRLNGLNSPNRSLGSSETRISKTTPELFRHLGPAPSILLHASLDSLFVECNRSSQTSFTEENKGAKTECCNFFAYPTVDTAINPSILAPDEYGLRAAKTAMNAYILGAQAARPLTEL